MDVKLSNPTDLSLEAALELEEVKQGVRASAPALNELFLLIRTPLPAFAGKSISMLEDARAYPLLRDSMLRNSNRDRNTGDFEKLIEQYLKDLEDGVARADLEKIDEAKKFCLALNTYSLAREMSEFYARREAQDNKNIFDDSV